MPRMKLAALLILVVTVWACKKKEDELQCEAPRIYNIGGKNYSDNASDTFKAGNTPNFKVTITDNFTYENARLYNYKSTGGVQCW